MPTEAAVAAGAAIETHSIRYIDLINYNSHESQHLSYDPEEFRIRAVVGWSQPEFNAKGEKIFDDNLQTAIRQSQTAFFLQLVDHELLFKQDGSVSLEVNYIASMVSAFKSASLNIFWTPGTVKFQKMKRDLKDLLDKRKLASRDADVLEENREGVPLVN